MGFTRVRCEGKRMVPRAGLEPAQTFVYCPLKTACLPVSPPRHTTSGISCRNHVSLRAVSRDRIQGGAKDVVDALPPGNDVALLLERLFDGALRSVDTPF
jgi:hypothetical protein